MNWSLGGYFVQIAVFWGHAGCPLIVQNREVSSLWKFQMYYFYRKSNQGHGICPLYRGCPRFGESVIRGFTIICPWLMYNLISSNCYYCAIIQYRVPGSNMDSKDLVCTLSGNKLKGCMYIATVLCMLPNLVYPRLHLYPVVVQPPPCDHSD